jgi:hypothetical protein
LYDVPEADALEVPAVAPVEPDVPVVLDEPEPALASARIKPLPALLLPVAPVVPVVPVEVDPEAELADFKQPVIVTCCWLDD